MSKILSPDIVNSLEAKGIDRTKISDKELTIAEFHTILGKVYYKQVGNLWEAFSTLKEYDVWKEKKKLPTYDSFAEASARCFLKNK